VQQIVVTGDVPPLKGAAENGVKGWKFSPASVGGQPTAGVGRVNVVFNPFNPGGVIIPTKPLAPAEMPEVTSGGFWPAAVKTAKYAVYPANTVSSGTVVLDVKVGSDGKVANVRVLRGVRALSGVVTRVIKDWEFVPASYEGRAVESHTSVAFVFVSPAVGTM
jgi:TonB family protein